MKKWSFPEEFLHFVWRTKRFDLSGLSTTEGEPVQIIDFGQYNSDAGPDFLNARIWIGETLWAGNVEIHIRSSDWELHFHHFDPAYDNVVLHVVWEDDQPLIRNSGERMPTLELEGRVSPSIWQIYQDLRYQTDWLACRFHFNHAEPLVVLNWIDRLMVERLERKIRTLEPQLEALQNDWEQLLFIQVARSLGLVVNGDAMEELGRRTPIRLLWKYRDQPLLVEALLFGQAGLLESPFEDNYPQELKGQYRFLQGKHGLTPMQGVAWKFSRLRPASFPTIRIAQLAGLVSQSPRWFGELIHQCDWEVIQGFFGKVNVSWYWQTHYMFDKAAAPHGGQIGEDTIALIVINALSPVSFLFGVRKDVPRYRGQALQLLENLPPESNRIIRDWKKVGVRPLSAGQSQALLHWRRQYCELKRCLECGVGCAILK